VSSRPTLENELEPFAGKYQPVRVLGRGGMGLVFEASHLRVPGLRLAIKLLAEDLRGQQELVSRFEREAAAASSLTSLHAVKVFDYDVAVDGRPFIVMELLQGKDLGAVLDEDGPQPVARAVDWILQASDAIAEAHDLGIVHRDIKPSNLFLADIGGRTMVKVLDFGIAKRQNGQPALTQPVGPLGTPQYMAPEQIKCAATVDPRSDVWALGITLYELVTGETPFGAHSEALATVVAIASDPIADPRTRVPDLSPGFVAALMKALEKDPSARYASVRELMRALEPFAPPSSLGTSMREREATCDPVVIAARAAPEPAPIPPPPPEARRGWVPPRPHVGRWALGTAALVAGIALVLALARSGAPAVEARGESAVAAESLAVVGPAAAAAPEPARKATDVPDAPDARRTTTTEPAAATPAHPAPGVAKHVVLAKLSPQTRAAAAEAPPVEPPARPGAASRREQGRGPAGLVHGGLSGPGF
jgi:serine/threonine-protein kinase